jgi:hypothetical protein
VSRSQVNAVDPCVGHIGPDEADIETAFKGEVSDELGPSGD